MVYRIYVEKKRQFRTAENQLCLDIRTFLGIPALKEIRLVKRYDVQGISSELFTHCKQTVFSEVQVDDQYPKLPCAEGATLFAVESLPGQFDQRADSASCCIQLLSQGDRPLVRCALLYYLYGNLSEDEVQRIKKYVINPVESGEASLSEVESIGIPPSVFHSEPVLTGFITSNDLSAYHERYDLAMDKEDLALMQIYFRSKGCDPTLTELKVIDTYWSDHCRHTTFNTHLDTIEIEDPAVRQAYQRYLCVKKELGDTKPTTLMDIATIGAKVLKKRGLLEALDESAEINACTVKITVNEEPWLLLFKNETHNHPTEIEPFGGAATCIGGAIRDPLSGRAYVYQAMRITGAGNPLVDVSETLEGRIPQRKLVTTAASGYSSYGNQIGLATDLVDELYHENYRAKHLELGAVIAAVPAKNVRREEPIEGDVIVLLGGRTGRDGCGGATGSSKSHDGNSLRECGSEVQKGNAPEERKLQRLLRNPKASLLIKRCNDFGAGGVSVAIGELAEGVCIDLDLVPVKYQGLTGTELAISESQERMAVVLERGDVKAFCALAYEENLEATAVATVTGRKALVMKHHGQVIVDIDRSFLDTNGASRHEGVWVSQREIPNDRKRPATNEEILSLMGDLNICSRQGLAERFDSTIGCGTVLMPFGGRKQKSPTQVMCSLLPSFTETEDCSVMSYGCDPYLLEQDPFLGGYLAVVHSLAKLVASGCSIGNAYLSLQEFFGKVEHDKRKWGLVFSALLGALQAQLELGVAAIGGKDSMSGSFKALDVPPTLVSFAVAMNKAGKVIANEFGGIGHCVYLLEGEEHLSLFKKVHELTQSGVVVSSYAVGFGGIAEALVKLGFGNRIGFVLESDEDLFSKRYGSLLVETTEALDWGILLGHTQGSYRLTGQGLDVDLSLAQDAYENTLESVYPRYSGNKESKIETLSYAQKNHTCARNLHITGPKVLIPVFPGTNCEYDLCKALGREGFSCKVFVVNNLSQQAVEQSADQFAKELEDSQVLFLSGGFSGGDEPDGSGKFIASFLRNPAISEQITLLLERRLGLVGGICNGFQALVKLGLLPYGRIVEPVADSPTLTFNTLGRHQSMLVRTRICSTLSPWLSKYQVGDVRMLPISHGEGRFVASEKVLASLSRKGQIATQYVDEEGNATMGLPYNPNGSFWAVEGITSADGRVFGRMAHSERCGSFLYRNTPYKEDRALFEGAYSYFA